MSFTLLGILQSQAAGAAQIYFLSVLGGTGNQEGRAVAVDSLDNAYVAGYSEQTNTNPFIAKYDTSASVEWQRELDNSSFDYGNAVAIDSLDNAYIFGQGTEASSSGELLLAKYNSSGSLQWQRLLGEFGYNYGKALAIDSLDGIYGLGDSTTVGPNDISFQIVKYNASGTLQWERSLGGNNREISYAATCDSANNLYVCGRTASAGQGNEDVLLAKYNSSGTIQWQRVLGGSGTDEGLAVAVDSSDNVYVAAHTTSTGQGNLDFLLLKYNSSGSLQWQRILGGSDREEPYGIALDSEDNIYICGATQSAGAGSRDFFLAKYNSSGTIQWQRVLGGSGSDTARGIAVSSSDTLFVFGTTSSTGAGSNDFFLAGLPNDGSLEGTYSLDGNNIVYQASSLTAATSSLTSATSSLTSATESSQAETSSLNSQSVSYTVVTEEI